MLQHVSNSNRAQSNYERFIKNYQDAEELQFSSFDDLDYIDLIDLAKYCQNEITIAKAHIESIQERYNRVIEQLLSINEY